MATVSGGAGERASTGSGAARRMQRSSPDAGIRRTWFHLSFVDGEMESEFVAFKMEGARKSRLVGSFLLLLLTALFTMQIALVDFFSHRAHLLSAACCAVHFSLYMGIALIETNRLFNTQCLPPRSYEVLLLVVTQAFPWIVCIGDWSRSASIVGSDPSEAWGENQLFSDTYLLLFLCAGPVASQFILPRMGRSFTVVPSIVLAYATTTAFARPAELGLILMDSGLLLCLCCLVVLARKNTEVTERTLFWTDRQLRVAEISLREQVRVAESSRREFVDVAFELSGLTAIVISGGSEPAFKSIFGCPMLGKPLTEMLSDEPSLLLGFFGKILSATSSQKISMQFHDAAGYNFDAVLCASYMGESDRISVSLVQTTQKLHPESALPSRLASPQVPMLPREPDSEESLGPEETMDSQQSLCPEETMVTADMSGANEESQAHDSELPICSLSGLEMLESVSLDGEVALTISDRVGCPVVSCTPGFTALSGPLPQGQSVFDLIPERSFGCWLQEIGNSFRTLRLMENLVIAPPGARRAGLEYLAEKCSICVISSPGGFVEDIHIRLAFSGLFTRRVRYPKIIPKHSKRNRPRFSQL